MWFLFETKTNRPIHFRSDQLQPRAHRHHHPMHPLQPRLLRRERQIRQQAPHIRSKTDLTPGDPVEARTHGETDRGVVLVDGELDLPVPEDE